MPDVNGPTEEPIDERAALAGELALGVLSGEERATALRRVVAEPAFAAEVDDWRMRLAPLMDGIAEVPAPAAVWPGIERAIAEPTVVRATRWRAAALTASAIAACLLVALVMPKPAAPPTIVRVAPESLLLAQVSGSAGAPLVTAHYDAATGRIRVRTSNLPAGERVPELWVIGSDATPRSLGIVRLNGNSDYALSTPLKTALTDGVTIAITLEPHSASPHAAPSGDILGTTKLTLV